MKRTPISYTQPKRDWTDARAKVETEGVCRICGSAAPNLEAAHIVGREHDRPKAEGSKTLYVHPDAIVPLCGAMNPSWAGETCHGRYDAHQADLLPSLSTEEQVRAVADLGSIELAWKRTAPLAYRRLYEREAA